MDDNSHAERLGNCIDGDIIVRRADAAGGEQIIVARAQSVNRLDNCRGFIRDNTHFLQADALYAEEAGDLGDVLVMGAARENLIANDDQRGGVDAGFGHGCWLGEWRLLGKLTPPPSPPAG